MSISALFILFHWSMYLFLHQYLAPDSPVSDTPWRGDWGASIQPCEHGSLSSPLFISSSVVGEYSHSLFCDIWLEQSGYCLNIFCLAKLPFPGLLARESRPSFVCLHPLAFPYCWLLELYVWNVWGRNICYSLRSEAPIKSLLFSTPLKSLLMFVLYIISKGFCVLSGRKKEKYSYVVFPKVTKFSFQFISLLCGPEVSVAIHHYPLFL